MDTVNNDMNLSTQNKVDIINNDINLSIQNNKVPYVISHKFLTSDPEQVKKSTLVWIDRFSIDKGTMSQIKNMCIHPSVDHVRIMPDCHRGKGCCIGFTSYLTEKIMPSYIGGDIGCGIITYPTGETLQCTLRERLVSLGSLRSLKY